MLAIAGTLAAALASAAPLQIDLQPLQTGAAPTSTQALEVKPRIILFWRSDCAPCVVELAHLDDLRHAAAPSLVLIVALEPAATARDTLSERAIPAVDAYAAIGDASHILAAASGGPTRLPLSVALDRHGAVCASHIGLLGTDMATAWSAQCSR